MKQTEFDFWGEPQEKKVDFCGPWGFIRSADGAFSVFCQRVVGKASFNSFLPSSWVGGYSE